MIAVAGLGDQVALRARKWLGTPYQHQASLRGVGADCLGLVRGIWREVYGEEPQSVPPYTSDWAERDAGEDLLDACERWLMRRPDGQMQIGDVLVFRMRPQAVAKHCGVLSSLEGQEPKFIHAYWARSVVESWMGDWWRRRIVAAFGWPEVAAVNDIEIIGSKA